MDSLLCDISRLFFILLNSVGSAPDASSVIMGGGDGYVDELSLSEQHKFLNRLLNGEALKRELGGVILTDAMVWSYLKSFYMT